MRLHAALFVVLLLLGEAQAATTCKQAAITYVPANPQPEQPVVVTFSSGVNNPIENLPVSFYNPKELRVRSPLVTDPEGRILFTPRETGTYSIKIQSNEGRYCGEGEMAVKKDLANEDVLWPQTSFETTDAVRLLVPTGVGVKILSADGALYRTLNMGGGGYKNFQIYDPGTYIIAVADVSTEYWGRNLTVTVTGDPVDPFQTQEEEQPPPQTTTTVPQKVCDPYPRSDAIAVRCTSTGGQVGAVVFDDGCPGPQVCVCADNRISALDCTPQQSSQAATPTTTSIPVVQQPPKQASAPAHGLPTQTLVLVSAIILIFFASLLVVLVMVVYRLKAKEEELLAEAD